MVKCPVCGRDYQNTLSLLKHVRLKSRYDESHRVLWSEYVKFKSVNDGYEDMFTETDIFREFLKQRKASF
ncbi:hypothetical protein [Caldivirga maquilingensis]|uniref:C2H2-type domain-containing protein n=1 Tax=Caldivirga maquilingensis (strain ATCC 700844 / DSM 13496 / JCM 10307 / IC-167) TaxID=397948 RepID=A8MB63_CALMQ|nr:hypothetical protein [Caldivirga maquilingensis]ABW01153.1 hypothetical protein Cmaq_0305 [Caldivirga maquilingensis IC-167]